MARQLARILLISVLIVALTSTTLLAPAAGEGSKEIVITDGIGREVKIDAPVGHIITTGKGATATVVQLGCVDKLSVCDTYSKNDPDPVFDAVRSSVSSGRTLADGNGYDSGRAAMITDIITVADNGGFDCEHDVIVVTLSKVYAERLLDELEQKCEGKKSFEKILIWYDNDIDSYDKIIDFCSKMSLVLTGAISDEVMDMGLVSATIADRLKNAGITDPKDMIPAFYITVSSSGDYKVGNTGSIATSMIQVAGGNPATVNGDRPSPTYLMSIDDLVSLREAYYGRPMLIFADSNMSDGDLERLKTNLSVSGSETTIVKMKSLWNSYNIECKDGVWMMACSLYPSLFEGDVPVYTSSGDDGVAVYVISGIVVVALLGSLVYLLERRHY